MSTSEIYAAGAASAGRNRTGRAAISVSFIMLCACALLATALLMLAQRQRQPAHASSAPAPTASTMAGGAGPVIEGAAAADSWSIRGVLSETCTCSVPCTCNFGEGPSPHSYCYPFYSYEIQQGSYGDTKLDGLHFGSADLKAGRTLFIDERADERQRQALRLIAMRVIEHVTASEAAAKAAELAPRIRYAAVKQESDDRHNHLSVAGIGEFAADYIMGLDKSQPLVVRNNTTWRIHDAIKAKTSVYRVRVGPDVINTKNTNSNQGAFEFTDQTDFGGPAGWSCGNRAASGAEKGRQECHARS